jgi:hypothetical protein
LPQSSPARLGIRRVPGTADEGPERIDAARAAAQERTRKGGAFRGRPGSPMSLLVESRDAFESAREF